MLSEEEMADSILLIIMKGVESIAPDELARVAGGAKKLTISPEVGERCASNKKPGKRSSLGVLL